jgi:hypothetical protein
MEIVNTVIYLRFVQKNIRKGQQKHI